MCYLSCSSERIQAYNVPKLDYSTGVQPLNLKCKQKLNKAPLYFTNLYTTGPCPTCVATLFNLGGNSCKRDKRSLQDVGTF